MGFFFKWIFTSWLFLYKWKWTYSIIYFFLIKKSYFDTFSNLVGVINHHILTICCFQQWFVKILPLMCDNKNLRKKNPSPRSLMSIMLRFTHWYFQKITSHSNVYFEPNSSLEHSSWKNWKITQFFVSKPKAYNFPSTILSKKQRWHILVKCSIYFILIQLNH